MQTIEIPNKYFPKELEPINDMRLLEIYYEYLKTKGLIINPDLMKHYLSSYDDSENLDRLEKALRNWTSCSICGQYARERIGVHMYENNGGFYTSCVSAVCSGKSVIEGWKNQQTLAAALRLRDLIKGI